MKNMRKKSVVVLAGLAVTGIVGASAASLGGITSNELGADSTDVESCDTDGVTVTYDVAGVNVQGLDVSGISADCAGQTMEVRLSDGTGGLLADGTVSSISGTTETVSFGAPFANATDVESIAITISGVAV